MHTRTVTSIKELELNHLQVGFDLHILTIPYIILTVHSWFIFQEFWSLKKIVLILHSVAFNGKLISQIFNAGSKSNC